MLALRQAALTLWRLDPCVGVIATVVLLIVVGVVGVVVVVVVGMMGLELELVLRLVLWLRVVIGVVETTLLLVGLDALTVDALHHGATETTARITVLEEDALHLGLQLLLRLVLATVEARLGQAERALVRGPQVIDALLGRRVVSCCTEQASVRVWCGKGRGDLYVSVREHVMCTQM